MRTGIVFACIMLCASLAWGQPQVRLLKIDAPADPQKAKNRLAIDVQSIEAIASGEGADMPLIVELATNEGRTLSVLATIDKGKVKWNWKVVDKAGLMAEFSEADFPVILEKVRKKEAKPSLQLQFRSKSSQIVVKTVDVTLAELPDLIVSMEYPVTNKPGDSMAGKINIKVENIGVAPARDFAVEVVLSADDRVALKKAAYSENFSSGVLLKDGRVEIPLLEPGKSTLIVLPGDVKLPDDAPPQKYYLAALVDPDGKVAELNRGNNIFKGILAIMVPTPRKVTIDLPDTKLTFEPEGYKFKLEYQGMLLSDGKDWRRCKMKAYAYQFKHAYWNDFLWEVDTYSKTIYEIRGTDFCKKGGKSKDLKIRVDPKGGSDMVAPKYFTVNFPQTQIVYEPEASKFNLLLNGNPIGHLQLWRVCRVAAHLFQLQYSGWTDFFLEVDTFKKEVRQVTGVGFCKEGKGTATVINKNVTVEY